jgi:hypothetical protein
MRPALNVVALLTVTGLTFTASAIASGQPQPQPQVAQPAVTPAAAADAWDEQRWADAANFYRVLSRENPDDGLFAFRFAYALHADGQYRRAIPAHTRAAEFGDYREVALYNLGCAHAALGDEDAAFEALYAAVDAGFDDREQMARDTDLFILHDDPRWNALVRGEYVPDPDRPDPSRPDPDNPRPDQGRVDPDVRFLLGEWEILDSRGRRISSTSIRPALAGGALTFEHRPDGGEPALTLLAYDNVLEEWRSVTVSDEGYTEMTGEAGRNSLTLEGELHTTDGETILQQVLISQSREGNIDFRVLESEGDGDSWRPVQSATWRRLGIVPPTYPGPSRPGSPSSPPYPGGGKPGLAGDKR